MFSTKVLDHDFCTCSYFTNLSRVAATTMEGFKSIQMSTKTIIYIFTTSVLF